MGRKKKKGQKLIIFCYYCDRTFEQEKVLIQHQRAKHFKCVECGKRLGTAQGMHIHMYQVHKQTTDKVPYALKGRDSFDVEVYGMSGVPEEILRNKQHEETGLFPIPKKQKINHAAQIPPGQPMPGQFMNPPMGMGMAGSPMGMASQFIAPGQPMPFGAPMTFQAGMMQNPAMPFQPGMPIGMSMMPVPGRPGSFMPVHQPMRSAPAPIGPQAPDNSTPQNLDNRPPNPGRPAPDFLPSGGSSADLNDVSSEQKQSVSPTINNGASSAADGSASLSRGIQPPSAIARSVASTEDTGAPSTSAASLSKRKSRKVIRVYDNELESMEEVRARCPRYRFDPAAERVDEVPSQMQRSFQDTMPLVGVR